MTAEQSTPPNPAAPREAERRARAIRKWRDAAGILTVLGVILFASPLISAVGTADAVSTVPLAVQYVFNVWAILIAAAFLLARLAPGPDEMTTGSASDAATPPPSPLPDNDRP